MGIQRYRADRLARTCPDGTEEWVCDWVGGPTLSKLVNCPTDTPRLGRRTVYVTGWPDSLYSLPAACQYRGRRIAGFLTAGDNDTWLFVMYTSQRPKLEAEWKYKKP